MYILMDSDFSLTFFKSILFKIARLFITALRILTRNTIVTICMQTPMATITLHSGTMGIDSNLSFPGGLHELSELMRNLGNENVIGVMKQVMEVRVRGGVGLWVEFVNVVESP